MSNNTTTKKITKSQMFIQIMENYELTDEERAFIEHEIELLAKKNSRKSDKPTKAQLENEGIKATILTVLIDNGDKMDIPSIRKADETLGDYSSSKFAALLGQMVKAGTVERIAEGRKVYFKAL